MIRRIVKVLTLLVAPLLVQGCAREKSFDFEALATGGYLIRASASSWRDPAGTASARATQDAEKFCRHEGRVAKIKEVKPSSNDTLVMKVVEVQFDCIASVLLRSGH
jgi:hypothetical protein